MVQTHDDPFSSGPPPCPCSSRQPQLNSTVVGRSCGCSTCLCGNGEPASSKDSERLTQPSSGVEGIQQGMTAININIEGSCCACCVRHCTSASDRLSQARASMSSAVGRPGHCGPYEITANGNFVLSDDWKTSTDGRMSYRVSFELRYNTHSHSLATQPPSGAGRSVLSTPVTNVGCDDGLASHAGEWANQRLSNGCFHARYAASSSESTRSPAISHVLEEIVDQGIEWSPYYPLELLNEDFQS